MWHSNFAYMFKHLLSNKLELCQTEKSQVWKWEIDKRAKDRKIDTELRQFRSTEGDIEARFSLSIIL